jgi:hypothetical protein
MPAARNNVKTAIHNASDRIQEQVEKTETMAVAAVERVDEVFDKARATITDAQHMAMSAFEVAGEAGRRGWDGLKEINGVVTSHGKDAVADMMETGRKTFQVSSFGELVQLHTAYATRRINAGFEAAANLNQVAHSNVIALWTPIAETLGRSAETAVKAYEPAKKKARKA